MRITSVKYAGITNKKNTHIPQTNIANHEKNNFPKNVSFGFIQPVPVEPLTGVTLMAIQFLLMLGYATADNMYKTHSDKNAQYKQYKEIFKEMISKEIERYQKAHNIDEKQAQAIYLNRLKSVIKSNWDHDMKTRGINAIDGHFVERFQMLTSIIMPIIEAEKSPINKNLIPNGVMFDTENAETPDEVINGLKKHLDILGYPYETLDLAEDNYGNPKITTLRLKQIFENADRYYQIKNKPSIIHLKNPDKLNTESDAKSIDFLKNNLENSARKGVVVILESKEPQKIDKALLRPERCDLVINIKEKYPQQPEEKTCDQNAQENITDNISE